MKDPDRLDAVFGSFNPLRLHMTLAGDALEYTVAGANQQSLATWIHERNHFHQTILTGFGQICWDNQRQVTSYLINEWKKLPLLPNGKRGLPLAHAAQGSIRAQVMGIVLRDATLESIKLFRARHSISRPEGVLTDLNFRLVTKPWRINPSIVVGGASHALQGNDILEGHALFAEATFLESHGNTREEIWDHSSLPQRYWIARDWFLEQIGDERYTDFPFICDLALQTSRRPDLPTSELEWQASCPAWRFVRLTEMLKQESGLTVGSPGEWKEKYESFAHTLLSKCKYKPINEVLEERLEALHRRPEMLHLEKLLERAIRLRLKTPWCAGNPIASPTLWEELQQQLPAPLVQIGGKIGNNSTLDQGLNNELVMELQYQALASQILGEFSDEPKHDKAVECAFKKFNIPNGCEYQRTDGCKGFYRPEDGPPHPLIESGGILKGCPFEALLVASSTPSSDIEVNPQSKYPNLSELEQKLSKQRAK